MSKPNKNNIARICKELDKYFSSKKEGKSKETSREFVERMVRNKQTRITSQ